MATLKERIQALEAASGSAAQSGSAGRTSAQGRLVALPGIASNSKASSSSMASSASPLNDQQGVPSNVATYPTDVALQSEPALRPSKSPSPQPASHLPLATSPSRRPPSLSVSQATPSPRRPTPTSNHSSPLAVSRDPPQAGVKPTLPPRLPSRPLAPAAPAVSSLTVSAPDTGVRQGSKHGQTPSTSSLASVSLSSDGEAEASTSRRLCLPETVKTRDHRVLSAPPLPARKASVSSIASSSSTATTSARKAPVVSPIASLPSPTRAPAAVNYSTYQPPTRSRTLPPPLAPKPAIAPSSQTPIEPTYAVRRKAPVPPPLAPRPSQQQIDAARNAAGGKVYVGMFDALLAAQASALKRGVVLEPKMSGSDQGWKRVSTVDGDDRLLASVVRVVWLRSGLSKEQLKDIWNLAVAGDERLSLSKLQFVDGLRRIDKELTRRRG